MASSFLANASSTARILQQARNNVNISSYNNGGSSCYNTITSRSRIRDRSVSHASTAKSYSVENTKTGFNDKLFLRCETFGVQNVQRASADNSIFPLVCSHNVRTISTRRVLSAPEKSSKVSASHNSISPGENKKHSPEFFLAAALAAAASGSLFFSSLDKHSSMTEPTNKASTVATSAVASTLLPQINMDVTKRKIMSKATSLGEGVREAVVSYQPKINDERNFASSIDDGDLLFDEINGTDYFVSVKALRGGRLHMEDEYYVGNGGRFTAVFDGHGGNAVSTILRDRLHSKVRHFKRIEYEKESNDLPSSKKGPLSVGSWTTAIRNAFREMDKEILMDENMCFQGSTAVAVFLHDGENGERTIISANIGDSRAILSRRQHAIDLTRDHKPNEKEEKARITEMGEEVLWDHYSKVYRVRGLSLSRAMGDKSAKPAVSGEVEIKSFPMLSGKDDEFVVLASDGLWDVMNSQDVVDFVHKTLKAPFRGKLPLSELSDSDKIRLEKERKRKMGRSIASKAYTMGSLDNICVVVVWLNHIEDPTEETKNKN